MRRLAVTLVAFAVPLACGGRSADHDEGSGGKGAAGGKGGASTGGSVSTGGTDSGGAGGSTGGSGGTTGGTGCCLAYPVCPSGEVEISGPAECPPELPGSVCHTVTACCSTIWCATEDQCDDIPRCDPGDAPFSSPCPPVDNCYERTVCGNTTWCVRNPGSAGASGAGGTGGGAGTGGSSGSSGMAGAPACDPETDYNRNYVAMGATCFLVDFGCTVATTYFQDDCGCGCEQPSDCPRVLDCSPSNPCTQESIDRCPFSERVER
jgi:hypothetical protein